MLQIKRGAPNLSVSVGGTPNSLYLLQVSTNLTDWVDLVSDRAPFEMPLADWPQPLGFLRAIVPR